MHKNQAAGTAVVAGKTGTALNLERRGDCDEAAVDFISRLPDDIFGPSSLFSAPRGRPPMAPPLARRASQPRGEPRHARPSCPRRLNMLDSGVQDNVPAPKLETLGPFFHIGSKPLLCQRVSQVSLSNPMRTVKVLAIRPSGYQLQVLNILRWFPCLEKLYVMFDINGNKNKKIEPQDDPLHPIECLQTNLKKVVFTSFIRYKEQIDFARFFVLNAKAVNKFEFEVESQYNSEWVAYQLKLLQVGNRASRDAQFEYKSGRLHTEFYLDEHIHDLLVADPFK